MARAAAKKGRAKDLEEEAESVLGAVGTEFIGVVLLGIAAIAMLALATYSPADAVFELVPVSNRAGVVGADGASVGGGSGQVINVNNGWIAGGDFTSLDSRISTVETNPVLDVGPYVSLDTTIPGQPAVLVSGANLQIDDGETVALQYTKVGTGLAIPAGMIVIEYTHR